MTKALKNGDLMPLPTKRSSKSCDEALVKSIIQMSRVLGIKVVAEGVEEREQLAVLTEAGCDYIQGYYFSKPLPANDVIPFLTQFSREQ